MCSSEAQNAQIKQENMFFGFYDGVHAAQGLLLLNQRGGTNQILLKHSEMFNIFYSIFFSVTVMVINAVYNEKKKAIWKHFLQVALDI